MEHSIFRIHDGLCREGAGPGSPRGRGEAGIPGGDRPDAPARIGSPAEPTGPADPLAGASGSSPHDANQPDIPATVSQDAEDPSDSRARAVPESGIRSSEWRLSRPLSGVRRARVAVPMILPPSRSRRGAIPKSREKRYRLDLRSSNNTPSRRERTDPSPRSLMRGRGIGLPDVRRASTDDAPAPTALGLRVR